MRSFLFDQVGRSTNPILADDRAFQTISLTAFSTLLWSPSCNRASTTFTAGSASPSDHTCMMSVCSKYWRSVKAPEGDFPEPR
mmetsp:Transcript_39003/g.90402  ORF Transcript_39003/g.90402 Transcript_39003/m.90402 type:complete len:83 (+) Transcript_39003:53-301(+)